MMADWEAERRFLATFERVALSVGWTFNGRDQGFKL